MGVIGTLVSAGAWLWAWRAEQGATRAEDAANRANEAVENLNERFQREMHESADLIVLRIGNGASVVNRSPHQLNNVSVAPSGTQVHMNDWPLLGTLAPGASGVVEIAECDPLWRDAVEAVVFWETEDWHRRVNLFPIVDVESAALNGLR